MRTTWTLLALAPALLALGACVPAVKPVEGDWQKSGSAEKTIDHGAWNAILKQHARAAPDGVNRIDYAAIKAKSVEPLKAYIKAMEAVDVASYPRAEQFAYWVNLYNAATVRVIVEKYPLKSIRDIGLLGQGPWKDKVVTVAGRALSLDDIEHGILRPIWKDVRIHYAVNCASIGCPNLALEAYRADTLEPMLERAARDYINSPRGFARRDGKLVASNIFEWYQSDWGSEAAVLAHARKYATGETAELLKDATKIDGYDYDWRLNGI